MQWTKLKNKINLKNNKNKQNKNIKDED